jgi:prepilin-type N-terminal cleavage/methylation domain-containing protein/prepilin-type processing-associated H-X9-DG protein
MRSKKGFTLIELLVVIAIIALLLSIIVPAMSMAKEHARRLVCSTNLKSMGTGLQVYAQAYKDKAISMADLKGVETYNIYNIQPWFGYNAGLNLTPADPYLKAVHLGKLYSETIVDIPDVFYCPTAEKTDEDDKFNLATYTTNLEKSMPNGNGSWGSPKDPTIDGRCRTNYMYWTWDKNTYKDMSLRPVIVDRLTSYSRIAHKKHSVPYGINALFGDGHVNMTLLASDKALLDLVKDTSWKDIATDRGVFISTLRLLRP